MERIRKMRNSFFKEAGKTRLGRVSFCVLSIALLWTFTDLISGNYEPKLRDDFICLVLGIMLERLLAWWKPDDHKVK